MQKRRHGSEQDVVRRIDIAVVLITAGPSDRAPDAETTRGLETQCAHRTQSRVWFENFRAGPFELRR